MAALWRMAAGGMAPSQETRRNGGEVKRAVSERMDPKIFPEIAAE